MYKAYDNTDFNLCETTFGLYKKISMLQLKCTATSLADKRQIMKSFNITPEENIDQFDLSFDETALTGAMEEFNKSGATDIKQLIANVIKGRALRYKVANEIGVEEYYKQLFYLLFLEARSEKYGNIDVAELNGHEINRALTDFFYIFNGRPVTSLNASV